MEITRPSGLPGSRVRPCVRPFAFNVRPLVRPLLKIDTLHPTAISHRCKPGKGAHKVLRFLADVGKLSPGTPAMSAEFMRRAIALALENVRTSRGCAFGAVVAKDA